MLGGYLETVLGIWTGQEAAWVTGVSPRWKKRPVWTVRISTQVLSAKWKRLARWPHSSNHLGCLSVSFRQEQIFKILLVRKEAPQVFEHSYFTVRSKSLSPPILCLHFVVCKISSKTLMSSPCRCCSLTLHTVLCVERGRTETFYSTDLPPVCDTVSVQPELIWGYRNKFQFPNRLPAPFSVMGISTQEAVHWLLWGQKPHQVPHAHSCLTSQQIYVALASIVEMA